MKNILFVLLVALTFSAHAQELSDNSNDYFGNDEPDGYSEEFFIDELENHSEKRALSQKNLTIIMAEQNWNLNIHTATYSSEAQILNALYEGLFSYDPKTLEPVPGIAESYRISRNKLRWTFTIRENASFSDGSNITAETVRDSWIALLETPGAPYASLLDCIKGAADFRNGTISREEVGITARDSRTLVVNLSVPAAHLPKILCHQSFSVCKPGEPNVFSGAFVIKERTKQSLVLARNEQYWDAANVAIPQITICASNDVTENSWKFNTGTADWISGMVDTNVLLNKDSMRISAVFGTEYLFFSCKNKPWDNAEFRNALLAAVPWDELRRQNLIPAETFIYPLAGYPSVQGISETFPEDALEIIREAKKNAGIPEEQPLKLTFGISASSERQKNQALILQNAWKPLGVELTIQTTPEDRYVDSISGWNADLFTYSWIGDFADPLAFLELFRGNSTLNPSKWNNQKFNELLDKAAETTDAVEHYNLLAKAEQLLLDDGEILPIAHSLSLHAINLSEIGGWYVNALDIHPYKALFFKESQKSSVPNVI